MSSTRHPLPTAVHTYPRLYLLPLLKFSIILQPASPLQDAHVLRSRSFQPRNPLNSAAHHPHPYAHTQHERTSVQATMNNSLAAPMYQTKHVWYQSQNEIVIDILTKRIRSRDVVTSLQPDSVRIKKTLGPALLD